VPDESGNYEKMKVKILSTKYEILNNTKAQMRKIQNKTRFGIWNNVIASEAWQSQFV